jgi:protein-arginine kinase activator protein McsA
MNRCKKCNLPFRQLTKKHLYCNKCKGQGISYYTKKPIVKKVCPICKDTFETHLSVKIYCSPQCRNDADVRSGPIKEIICANCNLPFNTAKTNKKFCTESCYKENKMREANVKEVKARQYKENKTREARNEYILSRHDKE